MLKIKQQNDLLRACQSRVAFELAQERLDAWLDNLLRKKRAKKLNATARDLKKRGCL